MSLLRSLCFLQALEAEVSGLERSLLERTQAMTEGQRIVAAAKVSRLQSEARLAAEMRAASSADDASVRQGQLLKFRCSMLSSARARAAARRAELSAAIDDCLVVPTSNSDAATGSSFGFREIVLSPAAAASALRAAAEAAVAAAEAEAEAALQRATAAAAEEAEAQAQATAAEEEQRRAAARLAAAEARCRELATEANAARLAGRAVAAKLSMTRTTVAASELELKAARERESNAAAELREAVATHAEAAARYALVAPGRALPPRLHVTVPSISVSGSASATSVG